MKAKLVLCVFLLSCASDDDDGGGEADGGGDGEATITLSGAQNATLPALAVASKVSSDSFSTVGVSITAPSSSFTSASISIRVAGTLAPGSYPASSFQIGVLEVSHSSGSVWTAYSTPPIGTIGTLTLTSVDVLSSAGNTTLYTIHGSLAASMLMQAQGSVNLTMTSTF